MRTHRLTSSKLWLAGAMIAGFVACGAGLAGEEPSPDALRERAANLERKVQALREEGRGEEARDLWNEVRELRTEAERLQGEGERRERWDRIPPEQQREFRQLRMEIRNRVEAGRPEEAEELERELARRQQALRRGWAERGEGQAEREAVAQQVRHLEVAMEHLHAAGLHDAAEAVGGELQRRRERMEGFPGGERPMPRLVEELRRLRAELNEVRENLDQLRREMEGLRQARR